MNAHTARTDKILVVDDDARIRDLLRRYLTQEGFEVMVAEDGKALSRILLRLVLDHNRLGAAVDHDFKVGVQYNSGLGEYTYGNNDYIYTYSGVPASQRLVTLNNCLRLYLGFTEHLWIARDLYGNNT